MYMYLLLNLCPRPSRYLAFPPPDAAPLLQSHRTSLAVFLLARRPLLCCVIRGGFPTFGGARRCSGGSSGGRPRHDGGAESSAMTFKKRCSPCRSLRRKKSGEMTSTSASQLPKNSSQLFLCSFLLQTSRYSKYVSGAGSAPNVLEHMA